MNVIIHLPGVCGGVLEALPKKAGFICERCGKRVSLKAAERGQAMTYQVDAKALVENQALVVRQQGEEQ